MSNSVADLHNHLIRLSSKLLDSLAATPYAPPEPAAFSVKSTLQALLSGVNNSPDPTQPQIFASLKDLALSCALLSSSQSSSHDLLSWIPHRLSSSAASAFSELGGAYCASIFGERNERKVCELLGLEGGSVMMSVEMRFVVELMVEVLPLLKDRIKESSIDKGADWDEVSAASSKAPVGYAIVAAYQFRWFVTQVDCQHLGKLCSLVIPCALTALDHWSPEVKGQGMITFIHLAKGVNAAELCWYEDVILDACCQNIVSADEIWHHAVEMSVVLVTLIQHSNPRSPWYERILNEMLGHLERKPRNREHRIAWLTHVEPLFHGVGLVLLAHFRRIFPLFFKWMHADDDETVLLVVKRLHTVIRLTWIRNSPYVDRLVDELVALYKEAAIRKAREDIRKHILEILVLLRQCKGPQFEAAWNKHRDDSNLTTLSSSLSVNSTNNAAAPVEQFHSDLLKGFHSH